jgi:hypothetical protein
MNKANTRELSLALSLLEIKDSPYIDHACRILATIQRSGTAADQRTILAIIKDRGLSSKFYTENHCLVAID